MSLTRPAWLGGPVSRLTTVGGVTAAVGVLLVAPSLFSPTWHETVSDRERGALLSEQWEWSWGRVRLNGVEGVELQDVWTPLGLAVLVVLVAVGLAGAVLWSVAPVRWAVVAAPVGVALLAGHVLATVAERHGRPALEARYAASGLTLVTDLPEAALLESAGAVVLLVALGLMVGAAVRGRVPSADLPAAPAARHLSGDPVSLVDTPREGRRA